MTIKIIFYLIFLGLLKIIELIRFLLVVFWLFTQLVYSQSSSLSGTIYLDDGDVAIGANVVIRDLNLGATTDINGKYNITGIKNGKYNVTISFIGFESISKRIDFNGKAIRLDSTLVGGINLDDVVVVGYGTQIKREISSSIITLSADEIKDKPSTNFSSSLQGKAAGVQITNDNGVAGGFYLY